MRCYCISKRAFIWSNLNHRIGEMDKHVILQQVSVMEEWTCHESGKINCQRQVHGTAAACRLQLQLLFFLSAVPSLAPTPTRSDLSTYNIWSEWYGDINMTKENFPKEYFLKPCFPKCIEEELIGPQSLNPTSASSTLVLPRIMFLSYYLIISYHIISHHIISYYIILLSSSTLVLSPIISDGRLLERKGKWRYDLGKNGLRPCGKDSPWFIKILH